MEFEGKLAIYRRGVNIPPSSIRKEVYDFYNLQYEQYGFDLHMNDDDVPIVVMIKRYSWTKDRHDFLNFFRWEQNISGIIFPKVIPKRILWGKNEDDVVEIKQKKILFKLTCCQLEAQTSKFVLYNGNVPFERILEMEHKTFRR